MPFRMMALVSEHDESSTTTNSVPVQNKRAHTTMTKGLTKEMQYILQHGEKCTCCIKFNLQISVLSDRNSGAFCNYSTLDSFGHDSACRAWVTAAAGPALAGRCFSLLHRRMQKIPD